MYSEEFKFLTLNNVDAWKQGINDKIEIRKDGSLALYSVPNLKTTVMLPDPATCPIGLAFKAPDTLFIIDRNYGYLYRYNISTEVIERILCINSNDSVSKQIYSPGNIAVSDTMLYIIDHGSNRMLALFLDNYQIRYILGATDKCNQPTTGTQTGAFNEPTDVALDSKESMYVVDQGNQRIQKFNKQGKFITQFGQEGEETLVTPTYIAIDNENFIYILDEAKSYLIKFDNHGNFIERVGDFNQINEFHPAGIAVDSRGKLYVGEAENGENQKIHVFDHAGIYLGTCPDYRGPSNSLAVDMQDNLYVAFRSDNKGKLAILKSGRTFISQGTYYSKVFDSTIQDCRWHRLVLDADIPPKTRLEIFYFLSNEFKSMEEIVNLPTDSWRNAIVSPEDALFHKGSGRYLWLKILFYGDEYHTPNLRRLTVYFPRLSYLRYLPAIYQEDEVSRDFLERFLSLFESFFLETEETISSIVRYVNPLATEGEFINWLCSWLAIAADENWEEQKKRLFISQAFNLYKQKGTKQGLEQIIELYAGTRPVIIEHFDYLTPMILGQRSALGLHTVLGKMPKKPLYVEETSIISQFALRETEPKPEEPFQYYAYDFTVVVNASNLKTEAQLKTLRRIIEAEKPAHTKCYMRIASPETRIGFESYIGVGTFIAKEPDSMKLGLQSIIGRDTLLKSKELLTGKIGTSSQIGINTVLN